MVRVNMTSEARKPQANHPSALARGRRNAYWFNGWYSIKRACCHEVNLRNSQAVSFIFPLYTWREIMSVPCGKEQVWHRTSVAKNRCTQGKPPCTLACGTYAVETIKTGTKEWQLYKKLKEGWERGAYINLQKVWRSKSTLRNQQRRERRRVPIVQPGNLEYTISG